MKLTSETLSFDVPKETNAAQTITALRSVKFTLVDEKGQEIRGRGEKAVYKYSVSAGITNDLVELTGNPVLTLTNGSTFQNSIIILDRVHGKLLEILRARSEWKCLNLFQRQTREKKTVSEPINPRSSPEQRNERSRGTLRASRAHCQHRKTFKVYHHLRVVNGVSITVAAGDVGCSVPMAPARPLLTWWLEDST
jgi:hypothetical protein